MLFDLIIDSIIVPPGVRAPCSTTVQVVVRNLGPDPAPLPFDVCLQIVAFAEEPFSPQYYRRIESEEHGGTLGVNQTVTAPFDLQFPCRPQAWVAAEVDCNLLLPKYQPPQPPQPATGHKRTNPHSGILMPVTLVPWLFTDLQVGQQASSGAITWGVSPLCGNIPVVAQVSVTNVGCVDAAPSTTGLTITGPAGPIASVNWPTGKIPPSKTVTFQHVLKLSTPAPSAVNVQACADTGGVVTGQCDTSGLCRSLSLPVSASGSGAPFPFLDDAAVVPGEQPITNWSLANDCSDLGSVTAEIISGLNTLHKSAAQAITPLGRASEEQVPLTMPASLWTVGQHFMELHVTATGMPAKSWVHTANLIVNLEVSRFTFAWAAPGTATWKKVYAVAGVLTNTSAFSTMSPAAITITEATATPGVTAAGAISVAPPAAPILLGAAVTLSIPNRFQSWTWIDPVTFQLSGPTAATFTYTATFTLTDGFGNAYPTPGVPVRTVTVAVSAAKIALQGQAANELAAALVALAAAVGLAAAAAIIAFALWSLAIWHKGQADDPPVPDFRYDERVAIEPRRYEFPDGDGPAWTGALAAVVELLERARATHEAMTLIHAKILGARVDRAIEAWRMQTDDYGAALARLRATAAEVPNAAAVAAEEMETDERWGADQMTADIDAWRSGRTVDAARQVWLESGLPQDAFADLERRMEAVEDLTPLADALIEIAGLTVTLSEAMTEESAEVTAPPEG
jgi:hypothetical protein